MNVLALPNAISCLEQQQRIDFQSYERLLSECTTSSSLVHGQRLHAEMLRRGHHNITYLSNLLIQMYSRCDSSLRHARHLLDTMRQPNVFSFTLVISAYASRQRDGEALQLFWRMELEGVRPDAFVLSAVVAICARTGDTKTGIAIHARIVASGMVSNYVLGNSLVNLYGKMGKLDDAMNVFLEFDLCDTVSWNSLMTAYAQNGHPETALRLLWRMDLEGVKLSSVSVVILLDACSRLQDWIHGERIHQRYVLSAELERQSTVESSTINMYGKCGCVDKSWEAFRDMQSARDTIAWNSMISAYTHNGYSHEALHLFEYMDQDGTRASRVTYLILVEACSSLCRSERLALNERIAASGLLKTDLFLGNSLISMHARGASISIAKEIFDGLEKRDVVSWNTMIAAYIQCGDFQQAWLLFRRLDFEGIRPDPASFASILEACNLCDGTMIHKRMIDVGTKIDIVAAIALIGMYGRSGQPCEARRVLDSVPAARYSIPAWNAMATALIQCGRNREAFDLHSEMDLKGLKLNETSFANLLTACSICGELSQGKAIHERLLATGASCNLMTRTALVNLYGKYGKLADSRQVFEETRQKDVICWTAMVVAYAQQGQGNDAGNMFRNMILDGMLPNQISFISILFACSHAGLLDEGCNYFLSMVGDHNVEALVDHYMCLIDLYGRVGKLAEAKDLLENMPFEPDRVAWTTYAGAFATQADSKQAAVIKQYKFRG